MAARLTDQERQAVIDALASGRSCRQIAADLKRSPSTVSKVARDVGHVFAADAPAEANRCRRAYSAERRALLATKLLEQAEGILMLMRQPVKTVRLTPKGDVVELVQDRPDPRATCDYARAVGELLRAEAVLQRRAGQVDTSVFGQWLASLKDGGSLTVGEG